MSAEQGPRFRVGEVPPVAEGFTERTDTGDGIADALVPGAAVALVPGPSQTPVKPNWLDSCGKTQIAAMIAESLWRSQAIDMLVWVSVIDRASVLSGFVEASVAATGIQPTGTAESVAIRFAGWLGETRRPWLVVLDDLPETIDLDGLWPTGPAGRLLITGARTGIPADAGRGPRTQVVPVGLVSLREALNGLNERLSVNPAQRQGAIDLVEILGREPLALAQAAAVVASSNLTCRDYRDFFVSRQERLGTGSDGMPSAATTWTISLERAESLLPGAPVRHMVVLLALLDGHGIPGEIFSTRAVAEYLGGTGASASLAADARWAWDVLAVMERTCLVSIHRGAGGHQGAGAPTVLMNSAVQAAIRLEAPAQLQEAAAQAAAAALLDVWPTDEPQPWTAAGLRANAARLHDSATDVLWADGCHPLLLLAGRSLDEARMVGSAVEYWQDLATRCETKLPPGHLDTLVVAGQLAAAYLKAGQAEDAVQWYQRVLAERTRELAPGHPAIVAARVGLARALLMVGAAADAVTVMLRAVGECEQFRSDGHPDTLGARDELAAAYQAAGELAAARRLLARNLADRERFQGPLDPQTIATKDRLAAAALAEGRVKDAIGYYKQALSDREKLLGRLDPDTIATRANLAAAYQAAGRIPDATYLSEQCCADSEQALGPDHAVTLARMYSMAQLYYAAGRVGDAVAVLRQTAIRCERTLPPGDPLARNVRQSLINLGQA
jgi:tetratricopeptide (TPR) repeat protein